MYKITIHSHPLIAAIIILTRSTLEWFESQQRVISGLNHWSYYLIEATKRSWFAGESEQLEERWGEGTMWWKPVFTQHLLWSLERRMLYSAKTFTLYFHEGGQQHWQCHLFNKYCTYDKYEVQQYCQEIIHTLNKFRRFINYLGK